MSETLCTEDSRKYADQPENGNQTFQTTVSPFLDMVKNLTFSGKTVVYIMERT